MTDNEKNLREMFTQWSGEEARLVTGLPASGSDRRYYRISGSETDAIGAWNPDEKENRAFVGFTKHFSKAGLPVPEIFAFHPDGNAYLQSDLGNETLFSILTEEGLSNRVKDLYRQVISWLPQFQATGVDGLDLSLCHPRKAFDRQSMLWDLNYFKYYFVRLAGLPFDEQALEDDFEKLIAFLSEVRSDYFMYRDFQSRNVMIAGNRPYFIDYQGGRLGPLQYDIASLLFDAKANLPNDFREELLNLYINTASRYTSIDHDQFNRYYYGFVLIRILQAMGAYGFRGFYQKKEHFLQSIPFALDNLSYLLNDRHPDFEFPTLEKLLRSYISSDTLRNFAKPGLKIRICSFSYKAGIPPDNTGNGGGFVFDCRALPNPGREEEFRSLTGLDTTVAAYLNSQPETGFFLGNIYNIVDQAVENYLARGFNNLMVSFGCTGGQHRSVYAAEQLTRHLNKRFRMNTIAEHTQSGNWPGETK
ncbi:MAG: phosphotransferase [Bacteroidales bacterium]|nr:phosphotransferase [Bacteroidales bacterium]